MKKINKFLLSLTLVLFVSLLTACGQDKNDSGEDSNPTGNDTNGGEVTVEPGDERSIYTFEAEYTYLDDIIGAGYSGGTSGTGVIQPDAKSAGASNGYYVSYLYVTGATLEFEIESDKAVTDAELVLRVSGEVKDMTITSDMYTVSVNGLSMAYDDMVFTNVPSMSSSQMLDFVDHVIGNISLDAGTNTITLTTSNSQAIAGTMYATAPMVDAIKIITDANLTWEPLTENLD